MARCERMVEATARLLEKMSPQIDVPRALLRGRFILANATIERAAI